MELLLRFQVERESDRGILVIHDAARKAPSCFGLFSLPLLGLNIRVIRPQGGIAEELK